jgi:biopolymer transport protein ExbD
MASSGSSGFYQDDDASVISDINVTPLVDVVLVLLIIFMVTARVIAERGIPLEKPKTVSGTQIKSTLTVTLDQNRALYVNGKRYDEPDAARAEVARERQKNPEVKAVISADVGVPHGEVMAAIDLVTQAGVTKFALASVPKKSEAGAGQTQ